MKTLISMVAFGFATSSFAGMGPPPTTHIQIKGEDAATVFGALYATGLATEYPEAQSIQVQNLICDLDTLAVIKGTPEENAWSCMGDVAGKKLQIQSTAAGELATTLSKYASTKDGPAYSEVSIDTIECDLDLLKSEASCDLSN